MDIIYSFRKLPNIGNSSIKKINEFSKSNNLETKEKFLFLQFEKLRNFCTVTI